MKRQMRLSVALICLCMVAVGAHSEDHDPSRAELHVARSDSAGIQPMSAEPQSVDGLIDNLSGLIHQGGRIAEGFEQNLQRGAGGLGQATGRMSDAFHGITDRFAALIKSPIRRSSSSSSSSSSERLHHESGSASEGMEVDSEAQAPVIRRAPKVQHVSVPRDSAAASRRAAARAVTRAPRVSHLSHGMRKSVFVPQSAHGSSRPMPAAGRVHAAPHAAPHAIPHAALPRPAKGLSYTEAKRIALKAAKPLAAQRGMDRKSMMKVVREAAREAAYSE